MNLGRVIGSLWATRKDPNMEGLKLQLIQPITAEARDTGEVLIAADTVGAGVGETIYYVTAYEAVIPLQKQPALVDASIVGIVDRIEVAL